MNKSEHGVKLAILVIKMIVSLLGVASPLILIWGLNLMGFGIDLTWKSIGGAFIVLTATNLAKRQDFKELDSIK